MRPMTIRIDRQKVTTAHVYLKSIFGVTEGDMRASGLLKLDTNLPLGDCVAVLKIMAKGYESYMQLIKIQKDTTEIIIGGSPQITELFIAGLKMKV